MIAHDTSPIDHSAVTGAVHVTSVFVSDARREVMRIPEIAHVLSRDFCVSDSLSIGPYAVTNTHKNPRQNTAINAPFCALGSGSVFSSGSGRRRMNTSIMRCKMA